MREKNVYEALGPGKLFDGKEVYDVHPRDPDNPDNHGTYLTR
ncbi:MAG: hypothetical protein AAB662_03035 [Patescibacteria group bacterium]